MQMTITARHFTLKDELKAYIEPKAAKLRRYYDGIIDMEIVLGWEKASRYTEFRINVHNKQIVIKESAEEIRKSFDLALGKAQRQIKRYKDKNGQIDKVDKRNITIPETSDQDIFEE
ncbi:MAG: ribosome-associated translation inhibitor RaiA [Calditrichaeota bacterium]|nr:ribosome-associated translation inhibitor RaiA [Calditrichota bacterium]MCB0294428.1 ribosome-associated translation inhibitor RaiA [Calditrichota bacterium]MCB0302649.1 ribosome-associated translation inhibitor RaiA [Calditrichota bacterium]